MSRIGCYEAIFLIILKLFISMLLNINIVLVYLKGLCERYEKLLNNKVSEKGKVP